MSDPVALARDARALLELPHAEAKRLLATGAPAFLLVNPLEYHGPHLPLRNDLFLALGLARDLHARLQKSNAARADAPLLLGPTLEMGVGPCPGPGSVAVSYRSVRRVVLDACAALADLGARAIVLMTGHGDPLHNAALSAAFAPLARRGVRVVAPMNTVLHEMLALEDGRAYAAAFAHVEDSSERDEMIRTLARDFHAGFFETSLALHYAPATVSSEFRALPPCPTVPLDRGLTVAASVARKIGARSLARELGYAAYGVGWYGMRPFPGYTGRPHRATADAGAFFAKEIVDRLAAAVEPVLDGNAAPTPPIMPWLAKATLGGAMGAPHVPLSAVGLPVAR